MSRLERERLLEEAFGFVKESPICVRVPKTGKIARRQSSVANGAGNVATSIFIKIKVTTKPPEPKIGIKPEFDSNFLRS